MTEDPVAKLERDELQAKYENAVYRAYRWERNCIEEIARAKAAEESNARLTAALDKIAYFPIDNDLMDRVAGMREVARDALGEAPMRLDGYAEPPAGIPADGEEGAMTQQGTRREGNGSTEHDPSQSAVLTAIQDLADSVGNLTKTANDLKDIARMHGRRMDRLEGDVRRLA